MKDVRVRGGGGGGGATYQYGDQMLRARGVKVTRSLPPDTCSAVPMATLRVPVGDMYDPLLSTFTVPSAFRL